jgi:hypothetical protein
MILTEQEAQTKRCQESFGSQPNAPFGSQHMSVSAGYVQPMSPTHCIGSACMAWRFSADETGDGIPRGYCGKAGLP